MLFILSMSHVHLFFLLQKSMLTNIAVSVIIVHDNSYDKKHFLTDQSQCALCVYVNCIIIKFTSNYLFT